ncbi:uncharacterized mitochondrial protein-like protein [Tanacetum coccineum]
MELESTNSGPNAKLPILKLGEYEMWAIRIKQYFQIQDYALWEVIENGDSWVSVSQTTEENGIIVTKMSTPLIFSQYPDAKSMFAAIETRFGGNAATKKTQKTLLKQQYENFSATSAESLDSIFNRLQKIVSRLAILGVIIAQEDLNLKFLSSLPPEWNTHVVVWMNKPEIETMSIDDLYNNFKIVEQKIKKTVGTSSGGQNLAFMTAPSSSSTNDANTASSQVSAASPSVNTASPQVCTASVSDNTVYAFMAIFATCESKESYYQRTGKKISSMGVHVHQKAKKQYDDLLAKQHQTEFKAITYKRGLDTVEAQLVTYRKNEVLFSEEVAVLKREVGVKQYGLICLEKSFEKHLQAGSVLFWLDDVKEPEFNGYGPKNNKKESNVVCDQKFLKIILLCLWKINDAPFSKDGCQLLRNELESKTKPEKKNVIPTAAKIEKPVKKSIRYAEMYRSQSPRGNQRNWNGQKSNQLGSEFVMGKPQLDDKGFVDSGCSRHMTGNIAYLSDFKQFDRGYVAFGGGAYGGKISSKGTLKTDNLDFEDVYFVNELKFNLFSVSQMCDKKNYVLFTDTECLVLSPNFKLPDENQILLKIPRKDNMYSFDMKNIVPKESLTCLVAKATLDESMLWHRRLGHINFKNINKLVKDNLERIGYSIEAARTMYSDSKLHTNILGRSGFTACYVQEQGFSSKLNNTRPPYELFRGKFDGKSDEGFFVGYSLSSKAFRVLEKSVMIAIVEVGLNMRIMKQEGCRDSSSKDINVVGPDVNTGSLKLNAVGPSVSTASPNEEDNTEEEPEVNLGNITNSYIVPTTPNTRIHKDHPIDNVIVWILVDLPNGKKAIRAKWVFRNKKDERGIVIRNKARLVAQGHRQEEDDIIFGSTNKELCTGFEKLMKDKFQMSSMGELTFFLGLQVQQKEDGIFISQDKYVAEILKKFNYSDVKFMVGSLMYLTASRPDIMFAVCACARFQVTTKTSHLLAVKRIFRYLKGKPTLGLWYSRDSPFELVAYTDSDYVGATLDRKSTTGGCQFLRNRLISWQCKKQTVVATSTTEAEYVAAASCYLLTKGFDAGRFQYLVSRIKTRLGISKEVRTPRYPSLVAPLTKVGDEAVHKELGDKMERAATTASSLEAEQDINPVIYTSCIEQFWATAKVQTVNGVRQLQALVDKKRVIVTESSIRRDLHLDDAEGTDCLPTATIFEELARMGYEKPSQKLTFYKAFFSPQWKYFIHTITQCLSAKSTAWNEFSSSMASLIICLATNQKFNLSKYIFDAMKAEVPQDEAEHEESVPTPSNDPQPSGEDSMQLTDLMVLCTKLQTQVLDLQKAKDAQAKEIAALKKRI